MAKVKVKRTYYDSGKLKQEWFEINGIKQGEYKEYWENGKLYEICNYVNGKKEGETKWYHMDGQLFKICNYVNGKYEGEAKYYGDFKKLIRTLKYREMSALQNNPVEECFSQQNSRIIINTHKKLNIFFDKTSVIKKVLCLK